MDILISGDPLHVRRIMQENSRREALGWIKITPVYPEDKVHYMPAADDKTAPMNIDSKEVAVPADTKTTVRKRKATKA